MNRRWTIVELGWDAFGTEPIWEETAGLAHRRSATKDETPRTYQDDVRSGEHGFSSRDELLIFLLPDDLRSPYLLPLGSVVSYSLGWVALTYGLKALVDGWEGINEALSTVPLQGFTPPA